MTASCYLLNRSLSGLLMLATLLACIGTAVGFLGRHWWGFELASHFRVQYLVIILVSGVIYLSRAKYRTAIVAGVFALVNVYLIVPFYAEIHAELSSSHAQARKIRALLINVNQGNNDYGKVREYIRLAEPDFMVLIEVNKAWMLALRPLLSDYPYAKSKAQDRYGIALFSRIPFKDAHVMIIGNAGRPSVFSRFDIDGQQLTVIGTHPSSPVSQAGAQYRNQQIAALAQFISSQEGSIILLGDLNITPWSPFLRDLLDKTGLRDTNEGYGLQPTWPVRFPPLWIPIDHALVSSNVVVHNREIGPDIGSDHYPVVVDFSVASH